MDRRVRLVLLAIAGIQALMGVGFALGFPAVTGLWPFPGTSPLSYTFIGSIFAAAAASTAWCLWADAPRALSGIALDYLTILAPASILSFLAATTGAGPGVAAFGLACVLGVVFGLWLLRYGLATEWRDPRPLPALIRWSFGFFIVALLIAGGALTVRVPNVMPWSITPELSTLFGLMFLGAAAYFAFGLIEPRWENAGGQLAGFLAYDAVLVAPFIQRLPTIDPALRLNLVVYTAVVVASGILAIWYLGLDRRTRLTAPATTA